MLPQYNRSTVAQRGVDHEAFLQLLASYAPEWDRVPPGRESVIRLRHRKKPYLSVVVYTTLVNGQARNIGQDAIRVYIRHENSGRLLVGFPKIYRTHQWGDQMVARVRQAFNLIKTDSLPRCPACETLMILVSPRDQKHVFLWVCPGQDSPPIPSTLHDVRTGHGNTHSA